MISWKVFIGGTRSFRDIGASGYVREKVVGWSTLMYSRFKTKSRWKLISWIHWLFYKRDLSNSKNVKKSLTQISLVKIFGRGLAEVQKFYRFLIHNKPLFFIHGLPFFPSIICFCMLKLLSVAIIGVTIIKSGGCFNSFNKTKVHVTTFEDK